MSFCPVFSLAWFLHCCKCYCISWPKCAYYAKFIERKLNNNWYVINVAQKFLSWVATMDRVHSVCQAFAQNSWAEDVNWNTSLEDVCSVINFTSKIQVYFILINALNVIEFDTLSQSVILLFILLQLTLNFIIPTLLSWMFQVNHTLIWFVIPFYQITLFS